MMKKNNLFIIGLWFSILASLFGVFSLFNNKGFSFHDETQIVNLFEYDKVISLGQFPPRWSPDTHYTYGSPYPEFNYQIPYYLGIGFHRLGFSYLDSYKLVLALSLIIGAVGMYLLGTLVSGPYVGLATAFLFTFTPYRAVDIYARGTVGEALGIGIFPWIVWSFYRLRSKQSFFNIFLAALSVSSLVLTHQPATVFGLPVILGIFILSELISKNYKFLFSLFTSLTVAFCLCSFYLIPVFLEQKYIQPVSPFNFYDHFPFIKQLIYSPWGYGVSIEGPYDGLSFQLGFANLAAIIIGFIVLIVAIAKKELRKYLYLFSTLIGVVIILFLMNNRSTFLWSIFPYTNSIQFPWRLLAIMALLTSMLYLFLLSGSKGTYRKLLLIVIPLIVLGNNYSYFHPGTIVDRTDNYYLRRYLPNLVLLPEEKVSGDYLNYTENYLPLPKDAVRPTSMPKSQITALQQETSITIKNSNPFSTIAEIDSSSGDFITIRRFYYPGWVVKIDGTIQKISLDKNGAMNLFVNKGNHILDVSFKDTFVRCLSNIISVITIITLLLLLIYNSKRKRDHSK